MDEAENQINDLEQKERKIIQSEQQEEKRIKKKKMRGGLGMPEEEKEQEIENLFEKNNERKLP